MSRPSALRILGMIVGCVWREVNFRTNGMPPVLALPTHRSRGYRGAQRRLDDENKTQHPHIYRKHSTTAENEKVDQSHGVGFEPANDVV